MARPPKGDNGDRATETEASPIALVLEKMADSIAELQALPEIVERLLNKIGTLELKNQALEDKVNSLQIQKSQPANPFEIPDSTASRILAKLDA